ncbi:hypothetical protein QBC39DRAFT_337694 [Podospora conica]|nr:hypothetical protein QBC39DRAFT_337694 [Schizothecium conicum]
MWMARSSAAASGGDRFGAAPLDSGLGFWFLACRAGDRAWPSGDAGMGITALPIDISCVPLFRHPNSVSTPAVVGRAEEPSGQRRPPGRTIHRRQRRCPGRIWRRRHTYGLSRAQSFRQIGTNVLPRQISCNPQSARPTWAGFHGIDAFTTTLPICAAVRPAALCQPTEYPLDESRCRPRSRAATCLQRTLSMFAIPSSKPRHRP